MIIYVLSYHHSFTIFSRQALTVCNMYAHRRVFIVVRIFIDFLFTWCLRFSLFIRWASPSPALNLSILPSFSEMIIFQWESLTFFAYLHHVITLIISIGFIAVPLWRWGINRFQIDSVFGDKSLLSFTRLGEYLGGRSGTIQL